VSDSDRFVKKKNIGGGSPSGKRVEAAQALTYNTNTGVRIDPPGAQIDGDWGGQKIIGRVEPPNPPPANRTLVSDNWLHAQYTLSLYHIHSYDMPIKIARFVEYLTYWSCSSVR